MTPSPVLIKPPTMDFYDALRIVSKGGQVTRQEWDAPDTYILMRGGFLCISQKGEMSRLLVSDGDIYAKDWIAIDDMVSTVN